MSISDSEASDGSPDLPEVAGHLVTHEGRYVYIIDRWMDLKCAEHQDERKFIQHLQTMNKQSDDLIELAGLSRIQKADSGSQADIDKLAHKTYQELTEAKKEINSKSDHFYHDVFGFEDGRDRSNWFRTTGGMKIDVYGDVIDDETRFVEDRELLRLYNSMTNTEVKKEFTRLNATKEALKRRLSSSVQTGIISLDGLLSNISSSATLNSGADTTSK